MIEYNTAERLNITLEQANYFFGILASIVVILGALGTMIFIIKKTSEVDPFYYIFEEEETKLKNILSRSILITISIFVIICSLIFILYNVYISSYKENFIDFSYICIIIANTFFISSITLLIIPIKITNSFFDFIYKSKFIGIVLYFVLTYILYVSTNCVLNNFCNINIKNILSIIFKSIILSLIFVFLIYHFKKMMFKKIVSVFFSGVSLSFYIVFVYILKNSGKINFISTLELVFIIFIIITIFHYYVYKVIFSSYHCKTKLSYAYIHMKENKHKLYIFNNIGGNFLCSKNDYMKCNKNEKIEFHSKILKSKFIIKAYLRKYKTILLYLNNKIIENEYNKYRNKKLLYIKKKNIALFRDLYKFIVYKIYFSKEKKETFERYYTFYYNYWKNENNEEVNEINEGIDENEERFSTINREIGEIIKYSAGNNDIINNIIVNILKQCEVKKTLLNYVDNMFFYSEYFRLEKKEIQDFFNNVEGLNKKDYYSKEDIDSYLIANLESINKGISYSLINVDDIDKNNIVLHLENIKRFYEL